MQFRYSFQQIVDLKNNERTQAEWILSEAMGQLRNEETNLHG
ncbi:flagellar export protein FliJ, partial [Paenibacillus anseongense]|nr:flagellar export protein FliJ [Paenibacillus anseongense]